MQSFNLIGDVILPSVAKHFQSLFIKILGWRPLNRATQVWPKLDACRFPNTGGRHYERKVFTLPRTINPSRGENLKNQIANYVCEGVELQIRENGGSETITNLVSPKHSAVDSGDPHLNSRGYFEGFTKPVPDKSREEWILFPVHVSGYHSTLKSKRRKRWYEFWRN